MEIKDLIGLKEPLTKLIEQVAKGTGIIFEPSRIKRKAHAEAEALKINSEGFKEVIENFGNAGALAIVAKNEQLEFSEVKGLLERAAARDAYEKVIETNNIESIVEKTVKHLPESVSPEDLDSDWRKRFFDKSKHISKEEIQEVWAKILAGEVSKPGSYSLRTLDFLSNISFEEANLFHRLSSYIELETKYVFCPHKKVRLEGISGDLPYGQLLSLEDWGFLTSQHDLNVPVVFNAKETKVFRYSHGELLATNKLDSEITIRMGVLSITHGAKELVNIVDPNPWESNFLETIKKTYSNLDFFYKHTI